MGRGEEAGQLPTDRVGHLAVSTETSSVMSDSTFDGCAPSIPANNTGAKIRRGDLAYFTPWKRAAGAFVALHYKAVVKWNFVDSIAAACILPELDGARCFVGRGERRSLVR